MEVAGRCEELEDHALLAENADSRRLIDVEGSHVVVGVVTVTAAAKALSVNGAPAELP